jgi:predicted  nucleic acid-binding Zn-ribbon protein
MKSKATLRKLAPLTRAIAKLQRDTHSLERRFDSVVKLADEIEQEGRALRRENAELRGKLTAQGAALYPEQPHSCSAGEQLWPEEAL